MALTEVTIAGGKYTVKQDRLGHWVALRHGAAWPAYPDGPDNLHVFLALEIDHLRDLLRRAGVTFAENGEA